MIVDNLPISAVNNLTPLYCILFDSTNLWICGIVSNDFWFLILCVLKPFYGLLLRSFIYWWNKPECLEKKQPTFDRKIHNPSQLGLESSAPTCAGHIHNLSVAWIAFTVVTTKITRLTKFFVSNETPFNQRPSNMCKELYFTV